MARVVSDATSIIYDDRGQGEPALLLLPGWCANRSVFRDLAPRCSVHRRSLALDWRGHGDSGPPSGDFGDEGLVEDALAVIRATGVQEVVPLALAHAGWVAIQLRRQLGAQIPKLLPAPPVFLDGECGRLSTGGRRWSRFSRCGCTA